MKRLTPLEREWIEIFNKEVASNVEVAKKFIEDHPDFNINVSNNNDNTALMMAARRGHPSKVKYLLELGADPNLVNVDGDTALLRAVRTGAMSNIKELIRYKANIHAINNDGQNALMMASGADARPIFNNIKFLLQCGFNVNAQDKGGNTALHLVMRISPMKETDWPLIVKHFLFSGADPYIKNKNGDTPLDIIEKKKAEDIKEKRFYHIKETDEIIGLLKSWTKEVEI